MLSDRTFGVEIEHNNKKYRDPRYRSPIPERLALDLANAGFATWANVHMDGSGFEVVSPVLKGEDGLKEFGAVLSWLEAAGGEMTQTDGFHVHHDGKEFLDKDEGDRLLRILLRSWAHNQAQINKLVAEWRGPSARAIQDIHCYKQITPEWVDSTCAMWDAFDSARRGYTPKYKANQTNRFGAINIQSLHKYGTIELRQHEGTFNYERASAWIRFGQKFIETCINSKEPIKQCTSPSGFLSLVGVSPEDAKVLKGKR